MKGLISQLYGILGEKSDCKTVFKMRLWQELHNLCLKVVLKPLNTWQMDSTFKGFHYGIYYTVWSFKNKINHGSMARKKNL